MAKSITIEGLKERLDIIEPLEGIEPITANGDFKKIAAEEAFMHEMVKVYIHPTTDVNANPYVNLTVNGERVIIPRAYPKKMKRMHLEVLARMKETRWAQHTPEGYIGQTDMSSLRGATAQAYPFQVLEDKNKLGPAWLEHILMEQEPV